MKIKLLFTAFICVVGHAVNAQSLRQPVSAIYLAASSYSSQHADVFSFLNNQAALAKIKNLQAGVYGEKRFLLAATSLYAFAVAIPTEKGNFGINVKYGGFKSFNESQIGIAYAKSLSNKVDIGIQFNYYTYKIPSYLNAAAVTFEIGTLVHLTNQLNLGIHVYNPVGGKFFKTGEKLTAAYKVGLGYDFSENFYVSTEIVKEENVAINVNTGVQYNFMKQFFARVGMASATSTSYAGFGVGWGNLRLDVTASYHPQLGLSPGLLLLMNLGAKDDAKPVETF